MCWWTEGLAWRGDKGVRRHHGQRSSDPKTPAQMLLKYFYRTSIIYWVKSVKIGRGEEEDRLIYCQL